MAFTRTELNLATGERVIINQVAYSNAAGDVVIIDEGETPPSGYSQVSELPAEPAQRVFNRLLAAANVEYQKDVDSLNKAFSLAVMFDGPTEEAKKANIRTQYAARKTKYAADVAALRAQYGV